MDFGTGETTYVGFLAPKGLVGHLIGSQVLGSKLISSGRTNFCFVWEAALVFENADMERYGLCLYKFKSEIMEEKKIVL